MCCTVDDLDLSFIDSQGGKELCVVQLMILIYSFLDFNK